MGARTKYRKLASRHCPRARVAFLLRPACCVWAKFSVSKFLPQLSNRHGLAQHFAHAAGFQHDHAVVVDDRLQSVRHCQQRAVLRLLAECTLDRAMPAACFSDVTVEFDNTKNSLVLPTRVELESIESNESAQIKSKFGPFADG